MVVVFVASPVLPADPLVVVVTMLSTTPVLAGVTVSIVSVTVRLVVVVGPVAPTSVISRSVAVPLEVVPVFVTESVWEISVIGVLRPTCQFTPRSKSSVLVTS